MLLHVVVAVVGIVVVVDYCHHFVGMLHIQQKKVVDDDHDL